MLSKTDIAIKENIDKDHVWNTFVEKILIDNEKIDEVCENCYEKELFRTCHEWQGKKNHSGYGVFNIYSKELNEVIVVKAHRFAYAAEYGFDKLPVGVSPNPDFVINHLCHNRSCVNPWHLEVITKAANTTSAKRKPKVTNG